MSLTAEVMKVTPETAQRWLDERAPNRKITPSTVKMYATDMANGKWLLSGETIIFNEAGLLIDGQHRLAAVVVSKTSVEMLVVGNVEADAFEVIDQGKSRNLGQVLDLKGYSNPTRLAQTIKSFLALSRTPPTFGYRYSSATCQEVLNLFPEILTLSETFKKMPGSDATVLGCIARLYQLDPILAVEFATALTTLANLDEDSPILNLYHTLNPVATSRTKAASVTSLNRMWVAAVTIKAWNSWITGKPARRAFQWSPKEKGGFPEPIDPMTCN